MVKKLLTVTIVCFYCLLNAQVGINTTNPQGIFHIDGGKDNPKTGVPSIVQQSNDFIVNASTGIGQGTISVGVGTTNPTERLDLANGNLRIRDINSTIGTGSDKLLVADNNGVIKLAGGEGFSVNDSGNRILDAKSGATLSADNDWNDNEFTTLKLNEQYDAMNSYDPSTGEFTIPKDGLYFMYGVCGFITPQSGSGVFDGTSGDAFTAIVVDGGRVSTAHNVIFRGAKNPGTNANLFFLVANSTLWLKAGQKITLQFLTYGTSNMVGSLSDLKIDKSSSRFVINKIL
ncbi:hypothetical protein SAMN05421664_2696 [Chryseobacterium soldanellicola]|uniref:Uncharacterized protein n=1 Tax=Chryseobacterium soldanellicola TaxID=311333 RepID=A0A1H1DY24_9FLAO|nr:hypothetical protein [Chryseobacterium soldanellicola]SDQ81432.1 hypothetical protein SAMN05421664_2696 [Chryseobacterium soldanellicola]